MSIDDNSDKTLPAGMSAAAAGRAGTDNFNTLLRLVFFASIASGAAQLGLVRELSANHALSTLDLSIRLVTGVVLASFGVGAALVPYVRQKAPKLLYAISGAVIGLYLIAALAYLLLWFEASITVGVLDVGRLLAIGVAVSPPFLCFGFVTAHLTARVQDFHPQKVGIFLGASLAGTAVGLILSQWLSQSVGVNALLVAVAVATLPALIDRYWLSLALAALCLILPTEQKLEALRDRHPNWVAPVRAADVKLILSRWSLYQKVDFYSFENTILLGCYNGYWQWWVAPLSTQEHKFPGYELIYDPKWTQNKDVLVIGSGAGMGILNLERSHPASITAVELDPLVLDLSKGQFKSYNDSIYDRVQSHAMDGRSFIDSTDRKFDMIVYEGSFVTSAHPELPVATENYLYTREGLDRAIQVMNPQGVGIIFYAGTREAFNRIREQIVGLHLPVESIVLTYRKTLWSDLPVLVFGRDQARVKAVTADVLGNAMQVGAGSELPPAPTGLPALTDTHPFLNVPSPALRKSFVWLIAATGLALIAGLLLPGPKRLRVYYYCIGAGLMMVQSGLMSWFRAFLGDPISTSYTALLLLLLGIGIGSTFVEQFNAWPTRIKVGSVVLAVTSSFVLLANLSFSLGFAPFLLRFGLVAAIVLPLGLTLGLFFPLGLRNQAVEVVPTAYLFDALGAVAGFFLFYSVALWGGMLILGFFAVALYLVAASLLLARS